MAYPYVPAFHDYGLRSGPTLAFVVHMAEGGGTVGFLSRQNARGVSVHYVIEYGGRIVQMLREDHASGSINPNSIRTTDDVDGAYGRSHAVAVLGVWLRDPNAASITVEVEGFAREGPNPAQSASLADLARDVASRHSVRNLGHRDFQDYKACPGRLIPWAALGGHGETDMGEHVVPFTAVPFRITDTARSFSAAAPYKELTPISGTVSVDATVVVVQTAVPHGAFMRVVTGPTGRRLIAAASGTFAGADCAAAVADETKRVKIAALAAIGGIK